MKAISTCILIFISSLAHSQFAIILDKDGYCNVRNSPEVSSKKTDTLGNGHFVYILSSKGSWLNVDYTKKNVELNGYVYKDRLKVVLDYENIPVVKKSDKTITLSKDSIKVIVTEEKFDKRKYKFSYYKQASDQIEKMNGKQYWGTDGEMPGSEYKSIIVIYGQKKIILPPKALENLFQPSLNLTAVNYDKKNDIIYIQSSNSDGAGSYEVIWRIEKGEYKDRYIAYGF